MAVREVPVRRAGRGPQPERAVDVHPRVVPAGHRDRAAKSSNAPLCTSPAPRQTIAGPSPAARVDSRAVDRDPALVVGVDLDDRLLAEPEVAHGAVDGVVAVAADHDAHPRRLEQPARGDVPAVLWPAPRAGPRTGRSSWPSSRRSRSRQPSPRAVPGRRRSTRRRRPPTAAAAGVSALMPAFWSQTEVSTSAPSAAGMRPTDHEAEEPRAPPSRQARRRRWRPARSTTATGSSPASGSGPPSAASISSNVARGHTGRAPRPGQELRGQLVGPRQHPSRVVHGVRVDRPRADMVGRDRHP